MESTATLSKRQTYQGMLEMAEQLALGDRLRLIEALMQGVRVELPATPAKKQHSILELRGLGKEIWQQINVHEYIQRERDSWDGPNHSIMPQSD